MWLFRRILETSLVIGITFADNSDSPQPAFRFSSEGLLIECLLMGLPKSSSVYVLPTMHSGDFDQNIVAKVSESGGDETVSNESAPTASSRPGQWDIFNDDVKISLKSNTRHNVGWLPGPGLLNDVGLYAVRCVSLYSEKHSQSALDSNARWPSWKAGAAMHGKKLKPNEVGINPGCAQLANLIGRASKFINESHALQIVESLKVGACPGIIVEGMEGTTYARSDEIFNAPPALIRVQRSKPSPSKQQAHCTAELSSWGRWLPLPQAKHMVVNGESIPPERKKYWVPYYCKST